MRAYVPKQASTAVQRPLAIHMIIAAFVLASATITHNLTEPQSNGRGLSKQHIEFNQIRWGKTSSTFRARPEGNVKD
jgi:hypothetical protein